MRGEDRELELVVDHMVVLARGLELGEDLPRRLQATQPHQGVVDDGVLPDRLAPEGLFMADVASRSELSQDAGDDVLRHRLRPDRPHHERRHQHVAPEVGREVGQAGHQLLAGAQQLDAPYVALEAAVSRRGEEPKEVPVEDLLSRERSECGRVGHDPDPEADGGVGARPDHDRPPGGLDLRRA